jgi:hypothetical protein
MNGKTVKYAKVNIHSTNCKKQIRAEHYDTFFIGELKLSLERRHIQEKKGRLLCELSLWIGNIRNVFFEMN